jgi:hypothetical protein
VKFIELRGEAKHTNKTIARFAKVTSLGRNFTIDA